MILVQAIRNLIACISPQMHGWVFGCRLLCVLWEEVAKCTLALLNTVTAYHCINGLFLWKNLIWCVDFTLCSSDGWVFDCGLLCVLSWTFTSKWIKCTLALLNTVTTYHCRFILVEKLDLMRWFHFLFLRWMGVRLQTSVCTIGGGPFQVSGPNVL